MTEIILIIYFSICGISLAYTFLNIEDFDEEIISNFWDWIIYSLFWIVQPIKSIIKFVKNSIK